MGCYLECERAPAADIRATQLTRFDALLREILPHNRFYARRLPRLRAAVDWGAFIDLPLTTKADLVADQEEHPPLGTVATYPADQYLTYHQTSGTRGTPLAVLDTAASWAWWTECWQYVYTAAGVSKRDRIFFAFSFGPFIGFWSAFSGAQRLGALTIPGGGADTKTRLAMIRSTCPTVLMATPTYALRLAESAEQLGIPPRDLGIRTTIHAGEPGASIPAVRDRIEAGWAARCYDHAGATEIGAYAYSCDAREGLHVNEREFIAEVVDPVTLRPVDEGQRGELVLTNLGRAGWPVIRYRTGDVVEVGGRGCHCGRTFLFLPGGLIGRMDDLMIVRGVNVYPSALEAIIRSFPVSEFRIVRLRRDGMEEIAIEIEALPEVAPRLSDALRQRLGLRIAVSVVPPEALPRFELKARRIVDRRDDPVPG